MLTPVKAHRARCLQCQERPSLVRKCEDQNCPSFPYRMGKNPNRAGIGNKGLFSQKTTTQVGIPEGKEA